MYSVLIIALVAITLTSAIDFNEDNWAKDCDFEGNNLKSVQCTVEECRRNCASTPGCTHYTWTNDYHYLNKLGGDIGVCYMKENIVSTSDAIPKRRSECGITVAPVIDWNKDNWAKNCDFKGNDLKIVHTSADECGRRCATTSGCTHYTWVDSFISPVFPYILRKGLGVCYLKKNVVFKSDAMPKSRANCGLMPSKGYSTSNWDCCKPSCSWSGKASVTSSVSSCSRDGETVFNDSNVQDGCSDGDAFTCNYYQPWRIYDYNGASFGFATARLPGKSEADLCCKCFKLSFTSGPISGKEMIVQVTSVDEDVIDDKIYFDLQIPGTGDSSSNGCSTQWGDSADSRKWEAWLAK
ncbi:hypothetical protein HA402_002941 [Bradysia odoriphaga]|nr:hypothetical protein HA402_002941 [Bradysia odoriphaga]